LSRQPDGSTPPGGTAGCLHAGRVDRQLVALKALTGRHHDLTDLGYLISAALEADLGEATASAAMIEERGFNRGQRLSEDLTAIIGQVRKYAGHRRLRLVHSVYDYLPNLRLPAGRMLPLNTH
jgi:hypothetical protein